MAQPDLPTACATGVDGVLPGARAIRAAPMSAHVWIRLVAVQVQVIASDSDPRTRRRSWSVNGWCMPGPVALGWSCAVCCRVQWRNFAAPCKEALRHVIHFHTCYAMLALTRMNHGPVAPPPLRTHERIYHAMVVHRAMIRYV
jgi:hypothetical protein